VKITACHPYSHSLDSVLRYFSESELLESKYQSLGATQIRIDAIEETDDGFYTKSRRNIAANVPVFLSSLLGSSNRLTQEERWYWLDDTSLRCELSVDISGVPIAIHGTMNFRETPDGCENRVLIELITSIPILGKKLEKFIANDISKSIEAEYQVIKSNLHERTMS
jgi:hypothetical protein